ncbi:MAG: hypothetical protein AB7S77_23690 [Desulfatirhabdiaceae bacterium]
MTTFAHTVISDIASCMVTPARVLQFSPQSFLSCLEHTFHKIAIT